MASSPSLSRAATPTNLQVEASLPESVSADEAVLVQLATAITDIKALDAQMWKVWREELSEMLPDITDADTDAEDQLSLEGRLSSSPKVSSS